MGHLSRAALERQLRLLLHTHDTPERTAAALSLGVAIGFSPFLGFHTVLGLGLAFVLNLNRVAVFVGVWINLPWITGAYYAAATALGAWILRTPAPTHLMSQLEGIWALDTWRLRGQALVDFLQPYFWPYTVGSLLAAALLAVLAYQVALPLIVARRRHLAQPTLDSRETIFR